MLFPVPMAKTRVVGLRRDLKRVIEFLHENGMVQVRDFEHPQTTREQSLSHYPEIAEQLLQLESISRLLPETSSGQAPRALGLAEALKQARGLGLEEELAKIQQEKLSNRSRRQELRELEQRLELFKKFNLDFAKLSTGMTEIVAARIPAAGVNALRAKLSAADIRFDWTLKPIDGSHSMAVIAVEKNKVVSARNVLESAGAVLENVPTVSGKPHEALGRVHDEIEALRQKNEKWDQRLAQMAESHGDRIHSLMEVLSIEKDRCEIASRFGRTSDFFILEGYIPSRDFDSFSKRIITDFGAGLHVEKLAVEAHPGGHETVPTLLDNAKPFAPFEFVTRFMSLPQAYDVDTTMVFAFIFPILYGMMLGDFVYALISMGFAWFIRKKTAKGSLLYSLGSIWFLAAIPSLFFGVLFNEYFGMSHVLFLEKFGVHLEHPLYQGLPRMENVSTLLLLTIFTGLAVTALGFLLGFVREWRMNAKAHAYAKLAWVAVIGAGAFVIYSLMSGASVGPLLIGAGLVFLLCAGLIVKVEGIVGLIEIPSVAGNILSYARIMAVGLSGVVIAEILNELVFPSPDQGLFLLVTLPLFIFGHAFNVGLAMFECFIQGARLNYVEFFSKFYEGGGMEFSPFKVNRKFTIGR